MSPKLTNNKGSIQVIIPKQICKTYGFKAGDKVMLQQTIDGVLMKPEIDDDEKAFYTIGYEGAKIDLFISRLKRVGVTQVIDVRERALSRKKGFSKSALRQALESEGILYVHMPELGSPKDIRNDLKHGGSLNVFMENYASYLDTQEMPYRYLLGHLRAFPTALMCFEKSHMVCHRRIISDKLNKGGYKSIHL